MRAAILGVIGAGLLAAVPAAEGAVVVAPRDGASLPARPVTVRVTAGPHTSVSARLNGAPVRERFGPSRRGRRTIALSPSHGLRYGANVLRVRAGRTGATVRFVVRRTAPLAAAGVDRTLTASTPLRLTAGASLSPDGQRLRQRWSVVATPRGVRRAAVGSTFRPVAAGRYVLRLTAAAGAARGSDDVEVTVKAPPMVAVDTMAKANDEDVRRGAAEDARGIRVGERFFPADPRRWLQLVVLDRDTLEEVATRDVDCPAASTFTKQADVQPCIDAARTFLRGYGDDQLVLASAQRPNGAAPSSDAAWRAQPPYGVPEALARIGVRGGLFRGPQPMRRGRISAIGVPGSRAGTATVHAEGSLADQTRVGEVTGLLTRDNNLHYTYVSDPLRYETQAPGSNATENVVQVGDRRFALTLPWSTDASTHGGFQVVVLDRTSPEVGARSRFFPIGRAVFDSGTVTRLNDMAAFLRTANDEGDKVILVASRGNPSIVEPADWQSGVRDISLAAERLVTELERAGATRTAAFGAIAPGRPESGFSYTLVGTSKAGAAQGVEQQGTAKTADGALSDVPLSGLLSRDAAYRLTPGTADAGRRAVEGGEVTRDFAGHVSGQKLMDTMFRAPSRWPETGDPARTAAIQFVSAAAFAGGDIRTAYWDESHGDKFWAGKQADIERVRYEDGQGFDAGHFAWAKRELRQEIDWVGEVQDFVRTQLAVPFTTGNLTKWADFTSAASTIRSSIQAPPDNKVSATLLALFNAAREGGAAIPGPVGKGFEIGNAVFNLVLELAEVHSAEREDAGAAFTARADELGPELAKRLDLAQETILQRYPEIVVSDYAKLKRVAACAQQRVDACPDAKAWKIDKNDQLAANRALQVGMRVELMSTLLPARYTLWRLGGDCAASVSYTCWDGNFQGDGFSGRVFRVGFVKVCPFISEPLAGKLTVPVRRDMPRYRSSAGFGSGDNDLWRVYALGQRDGDGTVTSPHTMNVPGEDLVKRYLDPLFAPVDRDQPLEGQGQQKERFYLRAFAPVAMDTGTNAFPYRDTTMDWAGRDTGCVGKL
jgi:hypothetical protein